jgi:DNA-binding response OmpR family regulator
VITLGDDDELAVLRAYESGSDHHLADSSGYLLLRAVLATLTRRTLQTITSRHLQIGQIHIDLAARTVDVNDTPGDPRAQPPAAQSDQDQGTLPQRTGRP